MAVIISFYNSSYSSSTTIFIFLTRLKIKEMNPKEVEKCYKCKNWIGFLENAVYVETGRTGQEWQVDYGFITNPLQKNFTMNHVLII